MRSVIGYYLVQQAPLDRRDRRSSAGSRQAKPARRPLNRWLAVLRPERRPVRSSQPARTASVSRNAF